MTFDGKTFNSLGLTPGIDVWSRDDDGRDLDYVTLTIPATVPELASLAIFGCAAVGLVAGGIRRRRTAQHQASRFFPIDKQQWAFLSARFLLALIFVSLAALAICTGNETGKSQRVDWGLKASRGSSPTQ
jgi:hypothetical protein